jgi:hypothetical protein
MSCVRAIACTRVQQLFDDLVAPAYYENYLAGPVEVYKHIFRSSPVWQDSVAGEHFAASSIFEPMFIRTLFGSLTGAHARRRS